MKYTTFKGKRGKWGVMSPDGKVIDVFISEQSATHHAQKLNEGIAPLHAEIATLKAALKASNAALAEAKSTVRKQQEAMESAIDSLELYLNANSPYTPAVLEAASYLSHALEDSAAVAATTKDESESGE